MDILEHLYTGFQGFVVGAIAMAYVADYNTSQLPIAILFILVAIISRIAHNKLK